MSSLFPFFAELAGRTVVVVGGGSVAARKVETLLKAGARITVVSPLLGAALAQRLAAGDIEHLRTVFNATHLDNAWFVVAATADQTVNRDVADAAHERRLWCNVVDDATLSSAQLPARVERGPLQVAISSGGASPMLARHLRERFEAELDDALGELATLLAAHRDAIRTRYPDTAARRRFFDRALRGELAALLRQGQHERARKLLRALLEPTPAHRGSVALVGAGPGDAGLLTLRALRVLGEADVILHDRLVSDAVLDRVRRDAERIEVGKQAGGHSVTQAHIHALMLEHARAGKRVVRLKGGDAFVFGRGGEELEFLRAHDIPYEVVPGITAALAAGAYAGIPLTHREHAQSLHLVTAHCANTADTLDWAPLAQPKQTVAFYMGVAALDTVRARLLEHGRAADTPFALVENASRPEQRVITGTLSRLSELATRHDVQSPALLVVGEVAALAGTLHWFGAPPLGDDAAVHSSLAHAA